jgi:tetratricopeptide (TPR) repeat protein
LKLLFTLTGPALLLSLLLFSMDWHPPRSLPVVTTGEVALCGAPGGTVVPGPDGKFIARLPGWGDRGYKISTTSDSAQYYFNQGLGFYYGYHFTEALASFREASRFDPSCAMTYWGQALAMGPFYNTYYYKMPKAVPETVAEMKRHAGKVTPKEKDLIAALSQRYSGDMTNADRTLLNRNYASSLHGLKKKYSMDSDIVALYVDAVMLEHKWDFWTSDGTPRPWTNELVADCEAILKKEKHPAILHYYIHLVEASRRPDRALSSADALKDRNPGIGHMVHMATHMYQRNGLYTKGVAVNEEANTVNNVTDDLAPTLSMGKDRSTHFFAVQSFCAMTAGMYRDGVPLFERARRRQQELTPDLRADTYAQFVYMMPVMARVRLGKWSDISSMPSPDSTWKYAYVLDQFAKGVAHVRSKELTAADKCLDNINSTLADSLLAVRNMPFNSPLQSCRIASSLLAGELLFARGEADKAFAAFRRAIAEEDGLIYREPHDWVIPARQFLGAYLLKAGRGKDAEAVYREDLVHNPGNGWSLLGLYQSLQAQGNETAATEYKKGYQEAFAAADVEVVASVF